MYPDDLIPFFFGAFMIAGAGLDLSRRHLPNSLCLLVLVAGAGAIFWSGGSSDLISAALHSVIALLVGMALFRFGMVGGGDAKFYAATAVWFPLDSAIKLLLNVSISGLGFLLIWFLYQKIHDPVNGSKSALSRKGFPLGVAIAFGAMALLLMEHGKIPEY